MDFEYFVKNYDVKLVLLRDKRRLTKKGVYGFFDVDGNVMVDRKVRDDFGLICNDVGILCQYVRDYGMYLCVLDIDSKDFPVDSILEKYPTSMVETNHGYHLHYLSFEPVRVKQLTGSDKERCPVDIRGQRDEDHKVEGNYVRYYDGASGDILHCDFNDVVSFCYGLFDIPARLVGEYSNDTVSAMILKQNNIPRDNVELFLAYYLYYQKSDWSTAYDAAFSFGIRMSGWLDRRSIQRVCFKLMKVSGYYGWKKWTIAFLSGYESGTKNKPGFGSDDLSEPFRWLFNVKFEKLSEKEVCEVAEKCRNVKLYEILKIIEKYWSVKV